MVLPYLGTSQGLVAAGFLPGRESYGATVLDLCDGTLEAPEFDRVKFVIGKIDGEQRRLDLAKPRPRVVISRCVKLPDNIVDLLDLQRLFCDALDVVVCIAGPCERRRHTGRAAHHQFEQVPGQTAAWRLRRGAAAPLVAAKLNDLDEQPAPKQVSAVDAFGKSRNAQQ